MNHPVSKGLEAKKKIINLISTWAIIIRVIEEFLGCEFFFVKGFLEDLDDYISIFNELGSISILREVFVFSCSRKLKFLAIDNAILIYIDEHEPEKQLIFSNAVCENRLKTVFQLQHGDLLPILLAWNCKFPDPEEMLTLFFQFFL